MSCVKGIGGIFRAEMQLEEVAWAEVGSLLDVASMLVDSRFGRVCSVGCTKM